MLRFISTLSFFLMCCFGQLMAQAEQPLQIAEQYLEQQREAMTLTPADITNYRVSSQFVSSHNKLTHLYLQQLHAGHPVHNAIMSMSILSDGKVLSVGNRFVGDLASKVNTEAPQLTAYEAVLKLMDHFDLMGKAKVPAQATREAGKFIFAASGAALEPIQAELSYQPMDGGEVRLAWGISFYQMDAQHWWYARIDALSGDLLDYEDWVISCDFHSSEAEDCTDHHDHLTTTAPNVPAAALSFNDTSNIYRVLPLFSESPDDAELQLKAAPEDLIAAPFGWHDSDGQQGKDYNITRGNSVHAYHDIFDLNRSRNDEPNGGDSLVFDFPYNFNSNRPYVGVDAAVTNLFYWNNLMHDVWYHYGFDEASGNFQEYNYTTNSPGNDHVRAEALDGSGTNNANMGTPPDGSAPRMQMYIWGNGINLPQSTGFLDLITLQGEPPLNGTTYVGFQAEFGGSTEPGVQLDGPLVDLRSTNTCTPITEPADFAGNIVLLGSNACDFGVQAKAAQDAGAVAVIFAQGSSSSLSFRIPADAQSDEVTIPVLGLDRNSASDLGIDLASVPSGIVPAGITFKLDSLGKVPTPGPLSLTSDFENVVIAHEYGHGVSGRLTGGAQNSGCVFSNETGSEGWSDWLGLAMTTTSENFANEPRPIGSYLSNGGIRSFPYSRNMAVNPDTYGVVSGTSQVHRVGSVWCAMIWDLYWDLVDEYGFSDDLKFGEGGNNMAMQLVLDGMKIQPCQPNFIDSRDAILAADVANYGGANQCLIWSAFARRGLGFDAQAGGIEGFNLPPSCLNAIFLEKNAVDESQLGDLVTYELTIEDFRNDPVGETIITDILPENTTLVEGSLTCNGTVNDGVLTINLGQTVSGESFTCSYQLQPNVETATTIVFDDGASNLSDWIVESPIDGEQWRLNGGNPFSGFASFYSGQPDGQTDRYLILEEAVLLEGTRPGLSFQHDYSIEAEYDGGVVEVSIDGGNSWEDVGAENFLQNGYDLQILGNSASALAGRMAFSGDARGYQRSIVDLSAYAGQEVQIRFRYASDNFLNDFGWYVDDVAIYGNLNLINNIACVADQGEEFCSETYTILLGEPVSTRENLAAFGLNIFPNPTSGIVSISLADRRPEAMRIKLLSINGTELLSREYDSFQQGQFDLSAYPAGIYLLRCSTEAGTVTRRVVVE